MPREIASTVTPLLERVRHHIRLKHYSIRTEEAYVCAVKRFILFHGQRHPAEMGTEEIRQFLSHLADSQNAAASTQNQTLSARLFLYRDGPLEQQLARAKRLHEGDLIRLGPSRFMRVS